MSDLSPHDAEQRAFIIGFSIAFYYAVGECFSSDHFPCAVRMWTTSSRTYSAAILTPGAWSNVLIWPASEVPHYSVAWQCSIALWCLVILELCGLRWTELKFIRCVRLKHDGTFHL